MFEFASLHACACVCVCMLVCTLMYLCIARCVADNIVLITKAFRRQFILPEFNEFCRHIDELYWKAKPLTGGQVMMLIVLVMMVVPCQLPVVTRSVLGQVGLVISLP